MTPFFFGANPAEVPKGPKQGLRILGDSQDIALELMESLDAGQKSRAMIYDEAPADIITFNSSRASLPKEEGLPASAMSGTQREMLMTLASEYVTRIRAGLAEEKLIALREGGLEQIHLAWGGPIDRAQPHYYRLHGGRFRRRVRQPPERRQPHPLRPPRRQQRLRRRRNARPPAHVPRPVSGCLKTPSPLAGEGWGEGENPSFQPPELQRYRAGSDGYASGRRRYIGTAQSTTGRAIGCIMCNAKGG